MTEDELRRLVATGHKPEVFIWRVDSDDGPFQWAAVVDDDDLKLPDGSRRQFAKLSEPVILMMGMGLKTQLVGAVARISLEGDPAEIEGLDDASLEANLGRIGFKPPKRRK